MGGVLRVEPASMHYKARLAKEDLEELSRKQPLEQDQAQPGNDGPHEDAAPLTILRRDGKKVATTSRTTSCYCIFATGSSCKSCLGVADKLSDVSKCRACLISQDFY